jgi:uncharacterized membrane protein
MIRLAVRERDLNDATGRVSRARRVVLLFGLAAVIFVGGTWLVPVATRADWPGADLMERLYAPLCHQISGRSFAWGGAPQAVCARCAGLYVGGAAGVIAAAWLVVGGRRPRPVLLAIALVPTLIDVALPWVGLPGLPNLPRGIVALPAGFVAGLFLAVGLEDLASRRTPRTPSRVASPGEVEAVDG